MEKGGDSSYINRSSLLYKSKVEYADFCINHVEGCSHGCTFPCYAMLMAKRFGKVKTYADWCKPKIVKNALELLDKEIPAYKDQIKFVHLCFMTDPFMYKQPEVEKLTLQIIERLNKDNIKCSVLTKGILPKELIDAKKYGKDNHYGITLVSLDNDFKRRFEPGSSSYLGRIKSLKQLHDNGLKTWVSMEPFPPPNLMKGDPYANLIKILNSISFVDDIIFGKLNYSKETGCILVEGQDASAYYEECARIVENFCEENLINYHIKYGTKSTDNTSTEGIFRKESLTSFQTL